MYAKPTQNQNESVNNMLWTLSSKRTFCGAKKLAFCVSQTVLKVNTGVGMKAVVLPNCDCEPTVKMFASLRKEDKLHIDHAEREIYINTPRRQKQRLDRTLEKRRIIQLHTFREVLLNQNYFQRTQRYPKKLLK